jgi:hypothetical protein
VARVNFADSEEEWICRFHVSINVYFNRKKLERIEETKSFEYEEKEVVEIDEIVLSIPYTPSNKGEYYFDIVVEDKMSMSFSKYRNFIKRKF